jgi:hypothetical protein
MFLDAGCLVDHLNGFVRCMLVACGVCGEYGLMIARYRIDYYDNMQDGCGIWDYITFKWYDIFNFEWGWTDGWLGQLADPNRLCPSVLQSKGATKPQKRERRFSCTFGPQDGRTATNDAPKSPTKLGRRNKTTIWMCFQNQRSVLWGIVMNVSAIKPSPLHILSASGDKLF